MTENPILQPKAVFDCFSAICQVPHPSKREEKMIAFLQDFGKNLGLETLVDKTGNVLIKKPATVGMEGRKTVVLQSHYPNAQMVVDADLTASFAPDLHAKTLDVLSGLQVEILNRK